MKKAPIAISILAVAISLAALAIALQGKSVTVSDERFQEQLEIALAEREKGYVELLKPKLLSIYDDMLEGPPFESDPETLGELLTPLIDVLLEMVTF